jgi:hypothetical protein
MRKHTLTLPHWLSISLEDNSWETVFEPGVTIYFPGTPEFKVLPPERRGGNWDLPEGLVRVHSSAHSVRISLTGVGEFTLRAIRKPITVAEASFNAVRAYEIEGRQEVIEGAVILPDKISSRMVGGLSNGILRAPIPFHRMIHLYLSARAVESRINQNTGRMKQLTERFWAQVDPIVSQFERTKRDPAELVEAFHWGEPQWLLKAAAINLRKLYLQYSEPRSDAEYVFKNVATKIS